jgi:hypothetical protein
MRATALSVNTLRTKRPYNNTAKRAGGWRGSPNSLAALLHFQGFVTEFPKCRACGKVALSGKTVCSWHAGRRSHLSSAGGRAERRTLLALDKMGLLPGDLLQSAAWRALGTLPTSARSPLRLRLVLAWSERERQPLMWAAAWRAAVEAGDNAPGDRGDGWPVA